MQTGPAKSLSPVFVDFFRAPTSDELRPNLFRGQHSFGKIAPLSNGDRQSSYALSSSNNTLPPLCFCLMAV